MNRLLRGDCTSTDVDYLNVRVLNGENLGVRDCWDAKFITFSNTVTPTPITITHACNILPKFPKHLRSSSRLVRNLQVSQALPLSTMRTLCQALNTPLFLSTACDVLVADERAGRKKVFLPCGW